MNNGMPNMQAMPGMPGMPGMPNMTGGNFAFVPGMMDNMGMGGHNCHCMDEIRAINNRIDSLERQIRRIERKLEPGIMPMPYGNAATTNSQMQNEYPQYQSGNYML